MPWGDDLDYENIDDFMAVDMALAPKPKRMLRYNNGKPPLSLLPTSLILAVSNGEGYYGMNTLLLDDTAQVLGYGARKYDAENWRKAGPWKEVLDCAMRHMHKMFRGETHDDESGVHHAAHVMCNIGFLLEFVTTGDGEDNRYEEDRIKHLDYEVNTINSVYDLLLMWKDGDNQALAVAAYQLAAWYENLSPEVRALRPGTGEFAFVKA